MTSDALDKAAELRQRSEHLQALSLELAAAAAAAQRKALIGGARLMRISNKPSAANLQVEPSGRPTNDAALESSARKVRRRDHGG